MFLFCRVSIFLFACVSVSPWAVTLEAVDKEPETSFVGTPGAVWVSRSFKVKVT